MSIRKVYPMIQRMLIEGFDPINGGGGHAFEFGNFDVPPPNARVNLLEAAEVCGRHIKTCEMLLSSEVDRAEAVLLNSIQWLEFWSVRGPTEEIREMFAKSLIQLGLGGGTHSRGRRR
jgi:hypothetical protein